MLDKKPAGTPGLGIDYIVTKVPLLTELEFISITDFTKMSPRRGWRSIRESQWDGLIVTPTFIRSRLCENPIEPPADCGRIGIGESESRVGG